MSKKAVDMITQKERRYSVTYTDIGQTVGDRNSQRDTEPGDRACEVLTDSGIL